MNSIDNISCHPGSREFNWQYFLPSVGLTALITDTIGETIRWTMQPNVLRGTVSHRRQPSYQGPTAHTGLQPWATPGTKSSRPTREGGDTSHSTRRQNEILVLSFLSYLRKGGGLSMSLKMALTGFTRTFGLGQPVFCRCIKAEVRETFNSFINICPPSHLHLYFSKTWQQNLFQAKHTWDITLTGGFDQVATQRLSISDSCHQLATGRI